MCCYLFFLAALTGMRRVDTARSQLLTLGLNLAAFIATVLCAYAVIVNDSRFFLLAATILDFSGALGAAGLLVEQPRNRFGVIMLLTFLLDLIAKHSTIQLAFVLISAVSPLIYVLIAMSLLQAKARKPAAAHD